MMNSIAVSLLHLSFAVLWLLYVFKDFKFMKSKLSEMAIEIDSTTLALELLDFCERLLQQPYLNPHTKEKVVKFELDVHRSIVQYGVECLKSETAEKLNTFRLEDEFSIYLTKKYSSSYSELALHALKNS